MNLEKLKKAAEENGFYLAKKTYVHKNRCTCGRTYISEGYAKDGNFCYCRSCGRRGPTGKTLNEAKQLWNEMVGPEGENV